jgi:hypothetical protein
MGLVEAIGTYSNLASLREKYTDLRKRIQEGTNSATPVTQPEPATPFEALLGDP